MYVWPFVHEKTSLGEFWLAISPLYCAFSEHLFCACSIHNNVHVQCIYCACSVHNNVRVQYIYCACSVHNNVHFQYIYTVHAQYIYSACSVHILRMFTAYAVNVQCIYTVHVQCIYCPFSVHILCMSSAYTAHFQLINCACLVKTKYVCPCTQLGNHDLAELRRLQFQRVALSLKTDLGLTVCWGGILQGFSHRNKTQSKLPILRLLLWLYGTVYFINFLPKMDSLMRFYTVFLCFFLSKLRLLVSLGTYLLANDFEFFKYIHNFRGYIWIWTCLPRKAFTGEFMVNSEKSAKTPPVMH